MAQWYGKVPTALNVREYDSPSVRTELYGPELPSRVTVCGAVSLLVHVMRVPRVTVMLPGLNAKFVIFTAAVACVVPALL